MANRFPLIFNSGAGQIQELAASDNLDLTSSNLVNAGILFTSSGSATAPSLQIGSGTTYNPGLYSPGTDQLAVATNGTSRLSIDASGNVAVDTNTLYVDAVNNRVAVGTTSPIAGYLLDVRGSMYMAGTNSRVYVDNGGVGGSSVQIGVSGTSHGYIGTDGNFPLVFQPNNTERARIRADGTFEIKGAGTAGSSPGFSVNPSTPANSFVIDSSGRLGIGSSSPGALLEASSATGSATPTPTEIRLSSTTNAADWSTTDPWARLGFYSADTTGGARLRGAIDTIQTFSNGNVSSLVFKLDDASTGLVERMRVTYDGKVGIGSNSPGGTLDIKAAASTHPLIVQGPSSEFARVDSSGRLLIGTSTSNTGALSQYSFLQAKGNSQGSGGAGQMSLFRDENSSAIIADEVLGRIIFGDQQAGEYGQIHVAADGTAAVGDYPGRLVFSTTPPGSASPTERMRITNAGIIGTFSTGTCLIVTTAAAANTLTANPFFIGQYGGSGYNTGTSSVFIFSNGNIQNTNNSYGAISDVKLKENIVDASSQWSDLKALQVRKFNFKEGQTHTQIGLIAQEVELVSPGLVNESPDRDADGNDLGTVTKSVNYSVLYMKAVKALQEAMGRIETLEQRLTAAGID